MATGSYIKSECYTCKKERVVYKCSGCLQDFCLKDLSEHNRELENQLDSIGDQRNAFQQSLSKFKTDLNEHPLIQQINQWETNAIEKIRQTAQEQRDFVLKSMDEFDVRLDELTTQLKQMGDEKDFNEIMLNQLKDQFEQLQNDLLQTPTMSYREESNTFINQLKILRNPIATEFKWKQDANVFLQNKLLRPTGIFIDNDGDSTIYIADANDQRIVQWTNGKEQNINLSRRKTFSNCFHSKVIIDKRTNSMFICEHGYGRITRYSNQTETIIGCTTHCFDLFMDKQGYLYTSDVKNHEVRRLESGSKYGTIVAGGNGAGSQLNQLSRPFYIFVDDEQSVYVSDCDNHRVVKWPKNAREGTVVAGGHGEGDGLHQLSYPNGIFVDTNGTIYIADRNNHRIVRWTKDAQQGTVIAGGNSNSSQMNRPSGISFDRENNLYVLDWRNGRLLKFDFHSK